MGGKVEYVLEGNLNYTGAVIRWLIDDLGLIQSSREAGPLAGSAREVEGLYLVPAFSGLGAPYWDGAARAVIRGMDRNTGKAEIVRAAEECIAYQITDILRIMRADSGRPLSALRADGGPTRDSFLMQFQADMADLPIFVPGTEEISGWGAALAAGLALGFYHETNLPRPAGREFLPRMDGARREALYAGWRRAVEQVLTG